MFEFCVSAGEGTLLDYGVCDESDLLWKVTRLDYADVYIREEIKDGNQTVMFRPASPDCLTGQ